MDKIRSWGLGTLHKNPYLIPGTTPVRAKNNDGLPPNIIRVVTAAGVRD